MVLLNRAGADSFPVPEDQDDTSAVQAGISAPDINLDLIGNTASDSPGDGLVSSAVTIIVDDGGGGYGPAV